MDRYLSSNKIRQKYLDFYEHKGHKVLPSASLVPEDPTVLLTIAGMLPFKPIFLGLKAPEFTRVTTVQKCIRTNAIETVGIGRRDQTFFEMLGNFSFNDYFNREAIVWAWELLTECFNIPPKNLAVTVYQDDKISYDVWHHEIGVPASRIQSLNREDNFWYSGKTGPCGSGSDIYYDWEPECGDDFNIDNSSRFSAFYHLVFVQYNRDNDGLLSPLDSKNIDTGMRVDRLSMILQNTPNCYETDLVLPIIQEAASIAKVDYFNSDEKIKKSLRIIGDHSRAVVHMIADGIAPSNNGRGYVLKRLLRRMVRHGRLIGIAEQFLLKLVPTVIKLASPIYPNTEQKRQEIESVIQREESSFLKTLEKGEKLLEKNMEQLRENGETLLQGKDVFILYDTYGFPLELTQEIAQEYGFQVDEDGFRSKLDEQRLRSQKADKIADTT
jgi:alanyl-tRNA synthetase